jgi:hypothetical protein
MLLHSVVRMLARNSSGTSSRFSVLSETSNPLLSDWELRTRNWITNEKATRQLGRPFLSRENSSNGGFIHQNFLRESYEP